MPMRRARNKSASRKSKASSSRKKKMSTRKRRTTAPTVRTRRKTLAAAASRRAKASGDFGVPAAKPALQRAASPAAVDAGREADQPRD